MSRGELMDKFPCKLLDWISCEAQSSILEDQNVKFFYLNIYIVLKLGWQVCGSVRLKHTAWNLTTYLMSRQFISYQITPWVLLYFRNRLPMISDDLSHWSDIFTWRQHHYTFIINHYETHAQNDPTVSKGSAVWYLFPKFVWKNGSVLLEMICIYMHL